MFFDIERYVLGVSSLEISALFFTIYMVDLIDKPF